MENFDNTQKTSVGKGLLFAIVGALLAIIACVLIIVVFEWIGWWAFGVILGGGISGGWALGKGPDGVGRQFTVVALSIVGGFLALTLGYAVIFYNAGIGRDFWAALEVTIEWFIDDFEFLIDFGIISLLAIVASWRKFDKNKEDDEEDLPLPAESENEMDDVLNQDVPTMTLETSDDTWE